MTEDLSFKCNINDCASTFKFTEAFEHIKVCQIPKLKCLASCTDDLKFFKGRKEMKDHFETDC